MHILEYNTRVQGGDWPVCHPRRNTDRGKYTTPKECLIAETHHEVTTAGNGFEFQDRAMLSSTLGCEGSPWECVGQEGSNWNQFNHICCVRKWIIFVILVYGYWLTECRTQSHGSRTTVWGGWGVWEGVVGGGWVNGSHGYMLVVFGKSTFSKAK